MQLIILDSTSLCGNAISNSSGVEAIKSYSRRIVSGSGPLKYCLPTSDNNGEIARVFQLNSTRLKNSAVAFILKSEDQKTSYNLQLFSWLSGTDTAG